MTVEGIKELVKGSDYDFLRNDPRIKDSIILLCLGGSHAYGTSNENSDVDVRGIALNNRQEILLGNDFGQVVDTPTDTTVYSLKKIISLLANCNPNTIEELGCREDHYLVLTDVGKELIKNRKMFLSKRAINSFGGYSNQQLYKLRQKASHSMEQSELEKHILRTLEGQMITFPEKYATCSDDALKLYIGESDREEMETEIFMDINLTHYPLRDYASLWSELQNTVKSYNKLGKRNQHALEHGKIAKHMTHLIRLDLMCLDILEREEIVTYREAEHDMLMEIRNGKYVTEDNQVKPEFFEIVNDYEKRLEYAKKNTSLPDQPDMKRINEFVMDVNERIVKGKI